MKKFRKLFDSKSISEQHREKGRHKPIIPRVVRSTGVGPRPTVDSAKVKLKEDLRNWFNPSHPEGGWKRINSKGEAIGPCAREPGEAKPKCMSNEKRAKLSKDERASAVRAKRKHDPNPERQGKPINVSNFGKGKLSEDMEQLDEKNQPTNPKLWARAVALAKSKFDVYPSAYANGWAAKWYKSKGGDWKTMNEEKEKSPFKAPYKKISSETTVDKSGAKHSPYSKVRHLARMAVQRQMEKAKKPVKEEVEQIDEVMHIGSKRELLKLVQANKTKEPENKQLIMQIANKRKISDLAQKKPVKEEVENDTEEKVEMVQSQLHFMMYACKEILEYIEMGGEVEEWYQVKVAKSFSEFESLHAFIEGEKRRKGMVKEDAELTEGEHIVTPKKMIGEPPKGTYAYERKYGKYTAKGELRKRPNPNKPPVNEESELEEGLTDTIKKVKNVAKFHYQFAKKRLKNPDAPTSSKEDENWKKLHGEEFELQEGRPSQRHPLEGHEYHKKTDAELKYIAKDAHEAAEAMKGHNTQAENKYRDQVNNASTVMHFRKTSGTPNWYKKKYGHMKEETEIVEQKSAKSGVVETDVFGTKAYHAKCLEPGCKFESKRFSNMKKAQEAAKKHAEKEHFVKEEVEQIDELSTELLGRYKKAAGEQARAADKSGDFAKGNKRFSGITKATLKQFKNDAKKNIKEDSTATRDAEQHAGSTAARTLDEKPNKEPMKKLQESRKTEIVKDIMKKKKNEKNSDKFNANPELSSEITKA